MAVERSQPGPEGDEVASVSDLKFDKVEDVPFDVRGERMAMARGAGEREAEMMTAVTNIELKLQTGESFLPEVQVLTSYLNDDLTPEERVATVASFHEAYPSGMVRDQVVGDMKLRPNGTVEFNIGLVEKPTKFTKEVESFFRSGVDSLSASVFWKQDSGMLMRYTASMSTYLNSLPLSERTKAISTIGFDKGVLLSDDPSGPVIYWYPHGQRLQYAASPGLKLEGPPRR